MSLQFAWCQTALLTSAAQLQPWIVSRTLPRPRRWRENCREQTASSSWSIRPRSRGIEPREREQKLGGTLPGVALVEDSSLTPGYSLPALRAEDGTHASRCCERCGCRTGFLARGASSPASESENEGALFHGFHSLRSFHPWLPTGAPLGLRAERFVK